MTQDPTSLDNLRDIVEPAPVSWWPLAPGWWVVIGVIAILVIVFAIRMWQNWKSNAYRRAAVDELRSASSAATIAEILKRTALCAYPRTQVASLSGSAWTDWLSETGRTTVPATVAQLLTSGMFRDTTDSVPPLSDFATIWIKTHKRPMED